MDKRWRRRKHMHLACALQFYVGIVKYGYTRNLSMDGALIECAGVMAPGGAAPKIGDLAVFSFTLRNGNRIDTLQVPCRIAHITGSALGLELFSSGLTGVQKTMFMQVLEADLTERKMLP